MQRKKNGRTETEDQEKEKEKKRKEGKKKKFTTEEGDASVKTNINWQIADLVTEIFTTLSPFF